MFSLMQSTVQYQDSFIRFYFRDHRFCLLTQLPFIFPIMSHYMDYEMVEDDYKDQ